MGAEETLTTAAAAEPIVSGATAGSVGMTTATLGGTVSPNSTDTKYYFVYGRTSAYGSTTGRVDLDAGAAATQVRPSSTG